MSDLFDRIAREVLDDKDVCKVGWYNWEYESRSPVEYIAHAAIVAILERELAGKTVMHELSPLVIHTLGTEILVSPFVSDNKIVMSPLAYVAFRKAFNLPGPEDATFNAGEPYDQE